MPNPAHAIALALLLNIALAASPAVAQSGSAGGSIGNDEKSLSGSRQDSSSGRSAEPAPSARRSKPAAEERSAPRRSGGGGAGGGGSFDGAWVVTSVGCGGTTTGATVVTSGRVIAEGVTGTVSANGSVHTFGRGEGGITYTGAGRLGSRSGSGTFRRSDGCGGTWTSVKQ